MQIERSQIRMVVVVVIAAGAFGAGLWWPTIRQINEYREYISRAEKDLEAQHARTASLVDLASEVEELRQEVSSHRKIIPRQHELAGVLRELSLQIEAAQLTGQGISTKPTVLKKDYVALPVELTFKGDSPSVWRFVRDVEQMPRLMQIESLEMSSDKNNGEKLQVTLHLTTYFSAAGEGKS